MSIEEDFVLEENIEKSEKEKYHIFQKIKKKAEKGNIKPEDKILVLKDSYVYFGNNISQIFWKKSRFITFLNEEGNNKFNKKYFIHNQDSLERALIEAKITEVLMTNEEAIKKNYDSNNSGNSNSSSESSKEVKIEDILEKSIDVIKQDKFIKLYDIFSKKNFENRFVVNKVKDLDFNLKKYKDFSLNNENDIDLQKVKNTWINEINEFYKKRGTNFELIITGPRGIGKTFNILLYSNLYKLPRIYFPIKEMIKYNNRKWKKIALYETLYIFHDLIEMQEFQNYSKDIPSDKDLFQFIYLYINYIFKFFEKRKLVNKILIILDNYDDSLDSFNTISKISDFIYNNNYKMLLCIIGNCPYIYNKYYNFILNQNQKYNITFLALPHEEENDILKIPLYNDKYNKCNEKEKANFKQILKNEIFEEFNKIELINDIKKEDFEHLPFEYLTLKKDEVKKNYIKISFQLNLYKEVFLESIKGLLKIDNIKSNFNLESNDDNTTQKDGIQFEDIIVEQIWNNTLGLYEFPEKNKIRINDIFSIKSYVGIKNKIEKNKNLIIRQLQFNGKYYDLLVIINTNKKRYGIFVQIGLSKNGNDIVKYFNNLAKYYIDYKKGIKKLIGVKINQIGFLLIFDYEKQLSLIQENSKSQGIEFCKENNIAYLIYKNFKLYHYLDSEDPITSINSIDFNNSLILDEIRISSIDIFKNNYIDLCEKMISEQYIPYILLVEEEKNEIIKCINKEYNKKFNNLQFITNMGKKVEDFLNFGFFCDDFEQVNIIETDTDKYIIYKSNIWIIKNNKLEYIEELEKNKIKKKPKNMTYIF